MTFKTVLDAGQQGYATSTVALRQRSRSVSDLSYNEMVRSAE